MASTTRERGHLAAQRWHGLHVVVLWRGDLLSTRTFRRRRALTVGPQGAIVLPAEATQGRSLCVIRPHDRGVGLPKDVLGRAVIRQGLRTLGGEELRWLARVNEGCVALLPGARAVVELGDFTLLITHAAVPVRFSRGWLEDDAPALAVSLLLALALTAPPLWLADPGPQPELRAPPRAPASPIHTVAIAPPPPPPRPTPPLPTPPLPTSPRTSPRVADPAPSVGAATQFRLAPPLPPASPPVPPPRAHPAKVARPESPAPTTPWVDPTRLNEALAMKPGRRRRRALEVVVRDSVQAVTDQVLIAAAPAPRPVDLSPSEPVHPAAARPPRSVAAQAFSPPSRTLHAAPTRARGPLARKQQVARPALRGPKPPRVARVHHDRRNTRAVGGLTSAMVRKVMRRHGGAFRACYQRALQQAPELSGRVELKMLIGPEGAVVGVRVASDSLGVAAATACVVRVARGLRFPAVPQGASTRVRYPLRFQPGT